MNNFISQNFSLIMKYSPNQIWLVEIELEFGYFDHSLCSQ